MAALSSDSNTNGSLSSLGEGTDAAISLTVSDDGVDKTGDGVDNTGDGEEPPVLTAPAAGAGAGESSDDGVDKTGDGVDNTGDGEEPPVLTAPAAGAGAGEAPHWRSAVAVPFTVTFSPATQVVQGVQLCWFVAEVNVPAAQS